jgi:hypothetical protein
MPAYIFHAVCALPSDERLDSDMLPDTTPSSERTTVTASPHPTSSPSTKTKRRLLPPQYHSSSPPAATSSTLSSSFPLVVPPLLPSCEIEINAAPGYLLHWCDTDLSSALSATPTREFYGSPQDTSTAGTANKKYDAGSSAGTGLGQAFPTGWWTDASLSACPDDVALRGASLLSMSALAPLDTAEDVELADVLVRYPQLVSGTSLVTEAGFTAVVEHNPRAAANAMVALRRRGDPDIYERYV